MNKSLNFRPYFSRSQVQENFTFFDHKLGSLLYSDEFNWENPLVRILRLANLEIHELVQDPSFYNHTF